MLQLGKSYLENAIYPGRRYRFGQFVLAGELLVRLVFVKGQWLAVANANDKVARHAL